MKGNYSLTIYVNDTSGNTISSTIIVSVVEKNNPIEPIPEEDPFENPMLWGIIVGGAFLFFLLITNIFLRRDLKKLEKNFRIENPNQNLKKEEGKSHGRKHTKRNILPKNKSPKKNKKRKK